MKPQDRDAARQVVQAEVDAVAEEQASQLVLMAAVTAAAWVARADGCVENTERDRLIAWVEETPMLDGIPAHEAAEGFDLRLRQLAEPEGVELAVQSLRRVAGHPKARLVVSCAEVVAKASGDVRESEQRVVGMIRNAVRPRSG